jgi:hypothetical protein
MPIMVVIFLTMVIVMALAPVGVLGSFQDMLDSRDKPAMDHSRNHPYMEWTEDKGRVVISVRTTDGRTEQRGKSYTINYLPADQMHVYDYIEQSRYAELLAPLFNVDDPVFKEATATGEDGKPVDLLMNEIAWRAGERYPDGRRGRKGDVERLVRMGLSGIRLYMLPLGDSNEQKLDRARGKLLLRRFSERWFEATKRIRGRGEYPLVDLVHFAGAHDLPRSGSPVLRWDAQTGLATDQHIGEQEESVRRMVRFYAAEPWLGSLQIDNETVLSVMGLRQMPGGHPIPDPRRFVHYLGRLARAARDEEEALSRRMRVPVRHPIGVGVGNLGVGGDGENRRILISALSDLNRGPKDRTIDFIGVNFYPVNPEGPALGIGALSIERRAQEMVGKALGALMSVAEPLERDRGIRLKIVETGYANGMWRPGVCDPPRGLSQASYWRAFFRALCALDSRSHLIGVSPFASHNRLVVRGELDGSPYDGMFGILMGDSAGCAAESEMAGLYDEWIHEAINRRWTVLAGDAHAGEMSAAIMPDGRSSYVTWTLARRKSFDPNGTLVFTFRDQQNRPMFAGRKLVVILEADRDHGQKPGNMAQATVGPDGTLQLHLRDVRVQGVEHPTHHIRRIVVQSHESLGSGGVLPAAELQPWTSMEYFPAGDAPSEPSVGPELPRAVPDAVPATVMAAPQPKQGVLGFVRDNIRSIVGGAVGAAAFGTILWVWGLIVARQDRRRADEIARSLRAESKRKREVDWPKSEEGGPGA